MDDGLVNVVVVAELDEGEALLLAGFLLGGARDLRHFAELKKRKANLKLQIAKMGNLLLQEDKLPFLIEPVWTIS